MFIEKNFYIYSLKRKRRVLIYLPDDYQSGKRYPVLLINDGQNAFFDEDSYAGTSWDFLESMQKLDLELILVAIPCNEKLFKREDEYSPWYLKKADAKELQATRRIGGEGKKYVNFLVKQLKPYLDWHFPTQEDNYGIVGSSMGGIIAFYAFLKYPNIFRNCALLSTCFWLFEKQFINMLKFSNIQNNVLYLDVGGLEGDERYLESNIKICKELQGKIKYFEFHYFSYACHGESDWARRVPYLLKMFYL